MCFTEGESLFQKINNLLEKNAVLIIVGSIHELICLLMQTKSVSDTKLFDGNASDTDGAPCWNTISVSSRFADALEFNVTNYDSGQKGRNYSQQNTIVSRCIELILFKPATCFLKNSTVQL